MGKPIFRLSVAACAIAVSTPALSVNYFCDGQITTVAVGSGVGQLWVSYGSIPLQAICTIGATTNGTTPETCRSWQALLLSAQAQGKTIRLYYDSVNAPNPTSCTGFQPWYGYNPHFVQTLD